MPTAENAKLEYEGGQNAVAMTALTDSGDSTTFTSTVSRWSRRSGYTPTVLPNGVITGGVVSVAASGSNDVVDVTALSCNLNGVVTAVSAGTDVSLTRPATAVSKVNSITVNSGGSIAVVAGADGSTTAFSETRGANGGPPYIPVDSIEIAQVRMTSDTAAAIAASEIFQVIGSHRESAMFPDYDINYLSGSITFLSALPAIHTGDEPKAVHASYSSPIFSEVSIAGDFTAPETTHTTNSNQYYNKVVASTTSTLNAGGFVALLNDGVTDSLVDLKNEFLYFRFYPDRYKTPYMIVQGKLGISRQFSASDNIQVTCTIGAEEAGVEYAS